MSDEIFWDYVSNSVDKIYPNDEELFELLDSMGVTNLRNNALRIRLSKTDSTGKKVEKELVPNYNDKAGGIV